MPDQNVTEGADQFHDDLDAWHAEHVKEPYVFQWAGKTWTIANLYDMDDSVLEFVDESLRPADIVTAMQTAFGAEQWDLLCATRRLPIQVMVEVFNRWIRHCGVEPGESSSSADSSPSTAGRSRRTSTASTGSGSTGRSMGRRRTATRREKS